MEIGDGMEPADPGEQGTRSGGGRPLAALERTLFFAGLALFWERLWRAATPLVTVLGSFLVLSWFGVWAALPDLLRLGLVAAPQRSELHRPKLARVVAEAQRVPVHAQVHKRLGVKARGKLRQRHQPGIEQIQRLGERT
ncbi:MAG TPA: DUF4175 family protein, partial [Kaistiaceae bacterium]|nr:DUF4175 family protein [Kaistiaceae bacterium]